MLQILSHIILRKIAVSCPCAYDLSVRMRWVTTLLGRSEINPCLVAGARVVFHRQLLSPIDMRISLKSIQTFEVLFRYFEYTSPNHTIFARSYIAHRSTTSLRITIIHKAILRE